MYELVSKYIPIVFIRAVDIFDRLLKRFSVSASLFHAGPLCGVTDERAVEGKGHVHIIQRGLVEVRHEQHPPLHIVEPSLLFYPRPLAHRFITNEHDGADFVCATLAFSAGRLNPIVEALPPVMVVPLATMPAIRATIDLLFSEVSEQRCGRQTTINRLFEVLPIQLLRNIVEDGVMSTGMLAGLSHPQFGKAIAAVHAAPAHAWSLEKLATIAGMSRSRFANSFKTTLGSTPGEYLCGWRMAIAQDLLRRDTPLQLIADEVGYGSSVALRRVFKARLGMSPRAWMLSERASATA